MRTSTCLVLLVMASAFGRCSGSVAATAKDNLGNVVDFSRDENTFAIRTSSGATVRIQILKNNMFRILAAPGDTFMSEGSHAAPIVIDTTHELVDVQLETLDDSWTISTSDFALTIESLPLTLALYRTDKRTLIWKELKPIRLSEDGSCQTLSSTSDEHFFGGGQQNGSFEFKGRIMEISYSGGWEEGDRPSPAPFYMSSRGYGVLRNTWSEGRYDFWSADHLTTLHREYRFDAYYFVGESINHVLELYTQLTGRAALLPRWAFEYGDADCYNDRDNVDKPGTVPVGWTDGPTGTTPDVISTVAAKYREYDMPCGWILPNDGYGCGYTELPAVVEGLAKYGFHTGLWTESGVDKIAWEVGTAGTRVQKLDVAWTGKGYQFALDANRDAAQGILDNSDSRPFVWTVMGWAGIQRYAVTWTGDQTGSWDFIRWHVPTIIGSGLSGMTYSTGDVDGIFGGSPETYSRDLQWKCFTPVLMGMSGWSKNERKHPWWFDEPYRSINRKFLKLRMRLMPYIYTVAREAEQTGAPIVRGLVWDHPDDPHAYCEETKTQFFLGRDMLIAPVFRSQASSGGWRDSVYLPAGDWVDFWDGRLSRAGENGLFIDYPTTLDKLPVFVRAGAILPLYPDALYDGQVSKDVLTLDIYPGDGSVFTLYEDDGNTRAYKSGQFSVQKFRVSQSQTRIDINLEPVQGQFQGIHERRLFALQVHTPLSPTTVSIDGQPLACLTQSEFGQSSNGWYFSGDDRRGVAYVKTGIVSVREAHTVSILLSGASLSDDAGTYPAKPTGDGTISADHLLVINRPAEEPGRPLENAFDGDPSTWFRTVRDQSVSYGPHEFVLSLGGRRVIDGLQIAPRNDKWWKYGQVNKYELYVSDENGNWGDPIVRDTLGISEGMQTVKFPPAAGRLLRFRVLSAHDPDQDSTRVPADTGRFSALDPTVVKPITISEFRVFEHQLPPTPRINTYLSEVEWSIATGVTGEVFRHRSADYDTRTGIWMNGLPYSRGLSARGSSRIDYRLRGDWQTFRVEAGIDDKSDTTGEVHLQVWGNDKLIFQTGPVKAPDIIKFELDIRGITTLSLRTNCENNRITTDWADAAVSGFAGDTIGK